MTVVVKPRGRLLRRRDRDTALAMLLVAPIAVVVGRVAAGLSALDALIAAVSAIVGLALFRTILARPEVGALAILVLVTIVPIDTLFDYDIAFLSGGLKITDLLLLVSLGSWTVARVIDPQPVRLPSRAVTSLLLAFVGLAVLGVFTAQSSGVELKFSLLELRAILSVLLVFPIVAGVQHLEDLEWALTVFLLAVAVGAVVICRDFILGRGIAATFSADATRIGSLKFLYPLVGVVWALALYPFLRGRTGRALLILLTGLSATALFFTLRRGGWVTALLALVVVAVLLPRHRRAGFGRQLIVMGAALALLIAGADQLATRPVESPIASARERLSSLGQSVEDVSARHRVAEFERARALIGAHPITGIGLGASITFISPLYDPVAEASNVPHTNIYVHNSYLWVALKLGLPALVIFLCLLGAVIKEAYGGYRRVTDPRASRLMLGALAALVALALVSLTEPHLTHVGATPVLAALIAVSQVVPRLPGAATAEPT